MATATPRQAAGQGGAPPTNPWYALWAMVVGFFMILVDSTIVAVANFKIMKALDIGFDTVIWVTSAYLVAYAVPLLVAGRLGDRFGPKNLYLIGLAVFTAASLWCGLSGSIGMLITARVVQGIGAALLTPQTLTMITRIFPPERRGVALGVWGATAGVATLVGPLAGGVLADSLGWEWIFFVNVPIGAIGLVLAARLIPVLPTRVHRFDLIGVGLSGVGVFLIVFALQEGQSNNWQPWIWAVIVAGVGFMVAFGYWQSINTDEPLVPLHLFADRGFSLSNLGIAVIGFATVAMMFPVMFYAQGVCGLSPTRSALLTAPMPIASGLFAPIVGRIVDRSHPRPVVGFGFSMLAIGLTWLSIEMTPTTPIWRLLLPFTALGIGMAFVWSPLGATATRNLPPELAGAGSGVFNATRQIGTVLGSAGMAGFMTWRLTAEMPDLPNSGHPRGAEGEVLALPAFLREPFSAAMAESMLLPAFIALFGVLAALFLAGSRQDSAAADVDDFDDPTDPFPVLDDYVEYTFAPRWTDPEPAPVDDGGDTDPLATGHLRTLVEHPGPQPAAEPIGFAHNGFHTDDERRFRPLTEVAPASGAGGTAGMFDDTDDLSGADRYGAHARPRRGRHHSIDDLWGRHRPTEGAPARNRHYRDDPDDTPGHGRHRSPGE